MTRCELCPRRCGVDRARTVGYCGEGADARVAKVMLHHFEEPCISGTRGSGAIFFSGCSMKCVFCQNRDISRGGAGEVMTPEDLASEMTDLCKRGAHNINLVTPTHFTDKIIEALDLVKDRLGVPVVWNTSGYELPETVRRLDGYVDVFLTDFKYSSRELSSKYSSAPDYAEYASSSLSEMVRITGRPVFKDGMMTRGVIVRHLVLPGAYRDSIAVLGKINDAVGTEDVVLSLMAQYTPEFAGKGFPELQRRITTFEYNKALDEARRLGFDGFCQSISSASPRYTPDFERRKE